MTDDEILDIFRRCGALLNGHYILSSGRHADTYFNKSLVGQYPGEAERLCRALAEKIRARFGERPGIVVSPAMGAITFGYDVARYLGLPFQFLERVRGQFTLRRGFRIPAGAPVLVVEDIISTGLSAREALTAVRRAGGQPLALAALLDRSGGRESFDVPFVPLLTMDVKSWAPDDLPPHLRDTPVMKPGSRGLS